MIPSYLAYHQHAFFHDNPSSTTRNPPTSQKESTKVNMAEDDKSSKAVPVIHPAETPKKCTHPHSIFP
jgi:hypothetical protein